MPKNTIFKILFYLINLLFLYKYSVRQDIISVGFIIPIYTLIFYVVVTKDILYFKFFSANKLKFIYFFTSILMAFLLFFIIHNTDGNLLNVDRWSAMDIGIKSLLNGQYPYNVSDHMNQYTSNLPGLFIIGFPFYLMGNVGYLQIITFLLLTLTLYVFFDIKKSLYYLLLLILSPAYWWEIFCLSDLMSNIFLLLCFFIFFEKKYKEDKFKQPYLLGILLGFFTLTRGIVIAPLAIYYFSDYWKISLHKQLKFAFACMITIGLLITMALRDCPDLKTLLDYHPLRLQTILLPNYIVILTLIIPFIFSFYIKKFYNDFLKSTVFCMLLPVLIAFGMKWYQNGLYTIITKMFFDISYLSMCLPFLILIIVNPKHRFFKTHSQSHTTSH